MSISHPQIKDTDRLIWVFVIVLASIIAFSLLKRDSQKKFGAVSYGTVPIFQFIDHENKFFDQHKMKGQVWIIHFVETTSDVSEPMSKMLDIVKRSWSDKRHLYILTVRNPSVNAFQPLISSQYIVSGQADRLLLFKKSLHLMSHDQVFLIDQNGVIRGIFSINSSENLRELLKNTLNLL